MWSADESTCAHCDGPRRDPLASRLEPTITKVNGPHDACFGHHSGVGKSSLFALLDTGMSEVSDANHERPNSKRQCHQRHGRVHLARAVEDLEPREDRKCSGEENNRCDGHTVTSRSSAIVSHDAILELAAVTV